VRRKKIIIRDIIREKYKRGGGEYGVRCKM
jgi:hypothetical protein